MPLNSVPMVKPLGESEFATTLSFLSILTPCHHVVLERFHWRKTQNSSFVVDPFFQIEHKNLPGFEPECVYRTPIPFAPLAKFKSRGSNPSGNKGFLG